MFRTTQPRQLYTALTFHIFHNFDCDRIEKAHELCILHLSLFEILFKTL